MPGLPNPWIILAVVVAFLAFGTAGYFKGRHDMEATYVAAALKAETKVVADVAKQDQVTEAVAEKAEAKQVEIRTVTQTIVKWRTKYVTQKADAACAIPVGFVRVHDAGARGEALPDTPGQSDDAASGIALSAVADTVTVNYGTYNEVREQLIALQDWVNQQQALWAAK